MALDRYPLRFDESKEKFEFVSEGTYGSVQKIIPFQLVRKQMPFYNLAFGDKSPTTGNLNDFAITNNGDTDKVLATVIQSLTYFFEQHPYATVFARGNTPAKTRLYQIGISKYLPVDNGTLSFLEEPETLGSHLEETGHTRPSL